MSDVDARARSERLQIAVADYIAKTKGRVAFQGDDRVVVITGRPVNHVLHLLLTLLTGGLWIFGWIIASAAGGETSHILTVDDAGSVVIQGDKTVNTGSVRLPRIASVVLVVGGLLLYPIGLRGPVLVVGLVVLVVGGLALLVTDVRKYGTGTTVPAVERI
jgi:hypothetical protein